MPLPRVQPSFRESGDASRLGTALLVIMAALACGPATRLTPPLLPPTPVFPFATDTLLAQRLRAGVTRWFIYAPSGPWAIHALAVDRDSCYFAVAVKGFAGAIGREKTSALLERLDETADVIGGVNADFFLFAPPGVPAGALVSRGRVVTGPSAQPVLAFDSLGAPHILTFRASGSVTIGARRYEVGGWNRRVANGVALFDANWGRVTDTASSAIEVVLEGRDPSRVALIDTMPTGVAIPEVGAVLVARGAAAAPVRASLVSLRAGDTLRADVALAPFHPWEAVGGRPVLLRDSAIVGAVDTEGQPGFADGRHPRTAVGVARAGKRLWLVVVDGRQTPYSDGMTLRELANLMLALGARDAINLDGGGSTTLVYANPVTAGTLQVANRPSDAAGERPVGNALAIVSGCSR